MSVNRTILLGVVGVVIVALALMLNEFLSFDPEQEAKAPQVTDQQEPAPAANTEEGGSATSEGDAVTPGEASGGTEAAVVVPDNVLFFL